MARQSFVVVLGLIPFFLLCGVATADETHNPYDIMDKNFVASGGLDKLKGVTSLYFEGTFTLSTLSGSFKNWMVLPDKNRVELDLTVFKQTTGDNGTVAWEMDGNGKVMISKDENVLIRREITARLNRYEHTDRSSEVFSLEYIGRDKMYDVDCHMVRTTNSLNSDTLITYYNSKSYLIERTTQITPDGITHTRPTDYRDIDGLLYPFRLEITELPTEQFYTIQFDSGAVNLSYDASLFDPPTEDADDFRFANGDRSENIPFSYIEDHIALPVLINGRERVWLLDTGADMSVIDSAYASEIGLKQEGNMTGSGVANAVEFSFVKLPPYSVGGVTMEGQTVVSAGFVAPFCHKLFGEDMVGILGYDFLSRFVTKIDYAKRLISFYRPDRFTYTGSGQVVDAPLKGNSFAMPMTVDGIYSGSWNFDCGAGGSSFHYPFAEANNLLEKKGYERKGFGAGGSTQSKNALFEKVNIGGYEVNNIVLRMPLEPGRGAFSGGELIGNLGNDILQNFVVWIDYERQQIILEPGNDFGKIFPSDRSGLQIALTKGNEYEVIYVIPGTQAEASGFKEADIVLAINDIEISYFASLSVMRNLFKLDGEVSYRIRIKRGENNILLELKLKNLL